MKAETYWLGTKRGRDNAIARLLEIELDGGKKCVISDTRNKSNQARGVQWMWYTEVAKSGIGRFDQKEDIHREAKWMFARPILLRDDETFRYIWPTIEAECKGDPNKMRYAVDHFISTEVEGFKIGEFLTDFERYWRGHGVNLTIPDPRFREWMEQKEMLEVATQ